MEVRKNMVVIALVGFLILVLAGLVVLANLLPVKSSGSLPWAVPQPATEEARDQSGSEGAPYEPGYQGVSDGVKPDPAQPSLDPGTAFDPKHIIYTGSIQLNTDDYKGTMSRIEDYAKGIGGFVQDASSNLTSGMDLTAQAEVLHMGSITLRVPADQFQGAMKKIQTFGIPVSTSQNSTNISQQYQDVQGALSNLKIQEERLISYLAKAEKIQDMLTIESELNRVRTQIDSLTTTIQNWDVQIAYSTIYVSVYEQRVATTTVKSPFNDFMGKLRDAFLSSINLLLAALAGLVVWFFRLAPFVVLIGAAFLLFWWFRKRKIRK